MYRLRRTTTQESSSNSSQQLTSSEMRHLTQRIHVLEEAYQEERHQRDLLEKKYARLKRRYIRLERVHAKMILESHAVRLCWAMVMRIDHMSSWWGLSAM